MDPCAFIRGLGMGSSGPGARSHVSSIDGRPQVDSALPSVASCGLSLLAVDTDCAGIHRVVRSFSGSLRRWYFADIRLRNAMRFDADGLGFRNFLPLGRAQFRSWKSAKEGAANSAAMVAPAEEARATAIASAQVAQGANRWECEELTVTRLMMLPT